MPKKRRRSKKTKSPKESSPRDRGVAVQIVPNQALIGSNQHAADDAPAAVTTETVPRQDGPTDALTSSQLTSSQWDHLRQTVRQQQRSRSVRDIFGDSAKRGTVYRWGYATATDSVCDVHLEWISRLATASRVSAKRFRDIDATMQLAEFQESLLHPAPDLAVAGAAVIWAAALPELLNRIGENEWWDLLGSLQNFRESLLLRPATQPVVLVGVVELGLTLATAMQSLPSCRRLETSSRDALSEWCEQSDLSLSAILSSPAEARLALASIYRIQMLVDRALDKSAKSKKHFKAIRSESAMIASELATWVAALTRTGGASSFSTLSRDGLIDDVGQGGLLARAADSDPDSLQPALAAAMGYKQKSKGRLAWQVSLPEAYLHDDDAKLACLLPEWDARRGRTIIDYHLPALRFELSGGKHYVLQGICETEIQIDGEACAPSDGWVATCEYSDDDIHYLELEQPLERGFVLQRQFMVLREDQCVFYADAVVSSDPENRSTIHYQSRFPLGQSMTGQIDPETRDVTLRDKRDRALVLPLAAPEWRLARSPVDLDVSPDQHLVLRSSGLRQLYAPMWIDLTPDRFKRNRTWRVLTVGENLQTVDPDRAVAYRVQMGRAQWILYRSLGDSVPRTFFGKHMIADFYCARFDSKDQSYEDLITVENT